MAPGVLLISPKGHFFAASKEFNSFVNRSRELRSILHYWNGISAALPTVAALTPPAYDLSIIDENLEDIDFSWEGELVGITAMTQQATRAYEIADEFRRRGKYVVLGGIHPTVMPEEAANHADTVILGEAEKSWPRFLREFDAGTQARRYLPEVTEQETMVTIPIPRYSLLSRYRYPVVWIQSGRGCPYDCEFCAASKIYGKTYRHKEIDQLVKEVNEVKRLWKFAQIGFADDNMFLDKSFSRQLLERFAKMNFAWYAQTDISIADHDDLLKLMHECGCRVLFIGFESVIEQNLRRFSGNPIKRVSINRYSEIIDKIQRNGIGVYGSFIIGLDGDDETTAEKTLDFIINNHLMGAQITLLTPFPGSRLRERLSRENRILDKKWSDYTAWNPVIKHPRLSPNEMENALLSIYSRMYDKENSRNRAVYFANICRQLVR